MKIKILSAILILCCTNPSLHTADYQKQTTVWTEKYLFNKNDGLLVPQEDLQLIANLCYFSFQRSHLTLKAQTCALKTISSVWNGWQNIAQTRLNPSRKNPHNISQQEKTKLLETFWTLHDEHQKAGKTYAHAADAIVDTELLKTTKASKAVSIMRSQSRAVVAQAIVDVRAILGKLFYTPQKKGPLHQKAFALLDYLKTYIPQLAVYSFSEADELNNHVSEDGWSVLYSIQDVGAKTWESIEEARASFYLSRYNAIIDVMKKNRLPKNCFEILFDHDGIVFGNKKTKYLPQNRLSL